MNAASLFLLVAALAEGSAGGCSRAESKLAEISKLLSRNAVSAATRLLAPMVVAYANCPKVLLARARVEATRNDPSQAQSLFERYIQSSPDDPHGHAYFARLLLDEGEYAQADAESSAAIDKDPNDALAMAVRGQVLDMKGESQEGLELLNRSSQLDPDDADTQFQLGAIYDRAKRPNDAVLHFEKVIALDPENPRAWDYLALNLEPLGEIKRSEEAYQQGLKVNREGREFDSFLDYNYGRLLMKRNDLTASKIHLDRAVELVSDMRAMWYERAKLNLRMKKYHQARTDAEKAASLPDRAGIIIDLQIYALLEQVYRRLGETALADKYAELGRITPPPVRGEHK